MATKGERLPTYRVIVSARQITDLARRAHSLGVAAEAGGIGIRIEAHNRRDRGERLQVEHLASARSSSYDGRKGKRV